MRISPAVLALPLLALLAAAGAAAAPAAPTPPQGGAAERPDGVTRSEPTPQKRIAFVVGDGAYAAGPLPTAANDAGLVAQTLQAAGFEVIGARDLDGETLRQSYADFLKRVADAGPDTVAFVYLSGYGLQYGDSNYYVPVGAAVTGATDIPVQSVRLSDLTEPLAALPLRARFTVFDAAYQAPFRLDGITVGGFSLVDAGPGSLVAFNAAPGTVAAPGKGTFGLYALALAAALRDPGLAPERLFEQVRLRVSGDSDGGEVPWDVSKVDDGFRFFEAASPAVAPAAAKAQTDAPPRDLPINEAYPAAVARDSLEGYAAFERAFPDDPLAKRAAALVALRREALTWRQALTIGTPAAFWSYLARYREGPHARLAHRRLTQLSAPPTPPVGTEMVTFDVPPPPAAELPLVERPVGDLSALHLPPPPEPPAGLLPPLPDGLAEGAMQGASAGLFTLPMPVFLPLPADSNPPGAVAFPAANPFYASSFGGGVPFGSNVFIGSRMVVSRIHRAAGPGAGVALPSAAERREAELGSHGITAPAQLDALRLRPGGVVGALASRDAALSADTRDDAFSPASDARPVVAEAEGATMQTGRSSRTDGPAPALVLPPALPAAAAAVRPRQAPPRSAEAPADAPVAARRERVGEASPAREGHGRQGHGREEREEVRGLPDVRIGGVVRPHGPEAGERPARRTASLELPDRGLADRGATGERLTDRGPADRGLSPHERKPARQAARPPEPHPPGGARPSAERERMMASREPVGGDPRRGPARDGAMPRGFADEPRPYDAGPGAFRGPLRQGLGGPGFGGPGFVRPGIVGGPRIGGVYLVPRPGRFAGPRPAFAAGPRFGRPGGFGGPGVGPGPRPGGFEGSYGGGLGSGFGGGFGGNF